MTGPLPPLLSAYRIGTTLAAPFAPVWLARRARVGKEEPDRLGERYGRPARPRPPGGLVWAHGASIGETLALLPVIEALVARGTKVLVTSGTVTSSAVLARRLPSGARHQYLPLDVPRYVRRFLAHWRPDFALFAESEIWPNVVLDLDARGIPLVLANARMSARSAAGWARAPSVAHALTSRIALCLAQSDADAVRLTALGAPRAEVSGNLKFDSPPPPADPAAVEQLDASLAGRILWLAASTHPGEDASLLDIHGRMRERHPGLLTVIAPRHPERGTALDAAARTRGLSVGRRSAGGTPHEAGDIYLADTVGELGLFFRLAPLVFMGGSLVPHGGQNPFEPARLGRPILHGPQVGNFAEVYDGLDRSGGAVSVPDSASLGDLAGALLADPAQLRRMGRSALEVALSLGGALERTLAALEPFLPPRRDPAEALW